MKNSERSFARRIDLTSLQLFVAVCELGSIGRAAEREFIAASAVSKRLSDLEATVDTALLYRHSRGVTLTPAFCRVSISPHRLSRSMTTPLPRTFTTPGRQMPEGMRCRANLPYSLTMVWPALLPP